MLHFEEVGLLLFRGEVGPIWPFSILGSLGERERTAKDSDQQSDVTEEHD
jgi:hypothetical protein